MTDNNPESTEPQPNHTKEEASAVPAGASADQPQATATASTDGATTSTDTAGTSIDTASPSTDASTSTAPAQTEPLPTAHPVANGAGWLVWVAGCTLLNAFCVVFKMEFGLALGLVGPLALGMIVGKVFGLDDIGTGISIMVPALFAAGFFFLLYFLAQRFHTWAFYVGSAFLAVDLLLNLMTSDWISTGIHAWAIFALIAGATACMAHNKARKLEKAAVSLPAN